MGKSIQPTAVSTAVYLLEMGSFASRSLEQDKATKCHGVPKDLQGSDLGPKQKHGASDQQDVLEGVKLSGVDVCGNRS